MRRSLAVLGLGLVAAGFFLWRVQSRTTERVFEPEITRIEVGNPCSWRDADRDLTHWFPGAAEVAVRDLILSGQKLTLERRLGRSLRPGEMSLHYYGVTDAHGGELGCVLPRRLKGPHGAIEFVIALDPRKKIRAFNLQAIREPEAVVAELGSLNLEEQLRGKGIEDILDQNNSVPGTDLTNPCARAIADEVRTALMLWSAGSETRPHH